MREVDAEGLPGECDACGEIELRSGVRRAAGLVRVDFTGADADGGENDCDEEKRRGGGEIARTDAAALPPRVEQKHEGQRRDGDLAEHRGGKPDQRERVIAWLAAVVVVDPCDHGEETRHCGERVFGLGDPRDGIDLGGMDRVEKTAEPRPAQAEPREQSPDEQRIECVQRDGDDVVAERVVAKEMPLDPEQRFVQRVVFGPTAGREPEFPEAVEIAHERLVGDVPVVVPKPAAGDGRRVDPEHGKDDRRDTGPEI